jgi:O-antigen/teichoic acid export membrane protein
MYKVLMALVIGLFVALLFLNLYFRAKVLKLYRVLLSKRVEFKQRHIFNQAAMEAEVIPLYPHASDEIREFARHIRFSIKIAVILLLLITVVSYLLYTSR